MAEMTERLLIDAGLGPGMRVLDVGCGRGDVALLVAKLVGAQGDVVGIDRDVGALDLARGRVREMGLTNVTFVAGDFAAIGSEHGVFDAAVGRRVLMYQADPVAALRAVVRVLRPGALVVFQEADGTMVPASSVALPLHARANRWMWQTVLREGGNLHMGFELAHALEQAGRVHGGERHVCWRHGLRRVGARSREVRRALHAPLADRTETFTLSQGPRHDMLEKMRFEGLTLTVESVERSVEFYSGKLG